MRYRKRSSGGTGTSPVPALGTANTMRMRRQEVPLPCPLCDGQGVHHTIRFFAVGSLLKQLVLSHVDSMLSNSVLSVSGEGRSELDEEEVIFYIWERYYDAFRRNVTLPVSIDKSKISASFGNGLLEIIVQGGTTAATEPWRI